MAGNITPPDWITRAKQLDGVPLDKPSERSLSKVTWLGLSQCPGCGVSPCYAHWDDCPHVMPKAGAVWHDNGDGTGYPLGFPVRRPDMEAAEKALAQVAAILRVLTPDDRARVLAAMAAFFEEP